jgi:hypothetical protein
MARPSSYNDEVADEILARIAAGESLIDITADDRMPCETTVYRWLLRPENERFCKEYARARNMQADHYFEEISDIRKKLRAGDIDANTARVEIDAIKWQMGKLRPSKYSDKIQIDQDHNININVVKYTTNETPPKQVEHNPKLID